MLVYKDFFLDFMIQCDYNAILKFITKKENRILLFVC